jgi:hypothetical protein
MIVSPRKVLDRPCVFITGAPRSGTSMVTKVFDAHPRLGLLMEAHFENRARLSIRHRAWGSRRRLARVVGRVMARLDEPVVGNKVCMPDVWSAEDAHLFCSLFPRAKIIFCVRDPVAVCLSRLQREEDFEAVYSPRARGDMLLDFSARLRTYTSSWRQSIEGFRRLRDARGADVRALYYDDFCADFPGEIARWLDWLELEPAEEVMRWYELPHHDRTGRLVHELKYADRPVAPLREVPPPTQWPNGLAEALAGIEPEVARWRERSL